jgi:hypothetical protein
MREVPCLLACLSERGMACFLSTVRLALSSDKGVIPWAALTESADSCSNCASPTVIPVIHLTNPPGG